MLDVTQMRDRAFLYGCPVLEFWPRGKRDEQRSWLKTQVSLRDMQ